MDISSFLGLKDKKDSVQTHAILLEILDLSIKSMVENEDCFYCTNALKREESVCSDSDLCKIHLFNGLEQTARKIMFEKNSL